MGGGGGSGGNAQQMMPEGGFFPDFPQLGGQIGQPWDMGAMFGFPMQGGAPRPAGQTIFDIAAAAQAPTQQQAPAGIFGPEKKYKLTPQEFMQQQRQQRQARRGGSR